MPGPRAQSLRAPSGASWLDGGAGWVALLTPRSTRPLQDDHCLLLMRRLFLSRLGCPQVRATLGPPGLCPADLQSVSTLWPQSPLMSQLTLDELGNRSWTLLLAKGPLGCAHFLFCFPEVLSTESQEPLGPGDPDGP